MRVDTTTRTTVATIIMAVTTADIGIATIVIAIAAIAIAISLISRVVSYWVALLSMPYIAIATIMWSQNVEFIDPTTNPAIVAPAWADTYIATVTETALSARAPAISSSYHLRRVLGS